MVRTLISCFAMAGVLFGSAPAVAGALDKIKANYSAELASQRESDAAEMKAWEDGAAPSYGIAFKKLEEEYRRQTQMTSRAPSMSYEEMDAVNQTSADFLPTRRFFAHFIALRMSRSPDLEVELAANQKGITRQYMGCESAFKKIGQQSRDAYNALPEYAGDVSLAVAGNTSKQAGLAMALRIVRAACDQHASIYQEAMLAAAKHPEAQPKNPFFEK